MVTRLNQGNYLMFKGNQEHIDHTHTHTRSGFMAVQLLGDKLTVNTAIKSKPGAECFIEAFIGVITKVYVCA